MKFVDEAIIEVHAGKGGDGAHLQAEKSIPRGALTRRRRRGVSIVAVATATQYPITTVTRASTVQGRRERPRATSTENLRRRRRACPVGHRVAYLKREAVATSTSDCGQRFSAGGAAASATSLSRASIAPRHFTRVTGRAPAPQARLKLLADRAFSLAQRRQVHPTGPCRRAPQGRRSRSPRSLRARVLRADVNPSSAGSHPG